MIFGIYEHEFISPTGNKSNARMEGRQVKVIAALRFNTILALEIATRISVLAITSHSSYVLNDLYILSSSKKN